MTPNEADVTAPSPWWDRDVYADRRPFLLARGRILSALREWFRRRGFLEVETPALQVSPGNETHLHAFATELIAPGGARAPLLSAHLAGVRLQEAAGRRRAADLQPSPACSATASAGRCTIPNSPCWNGTGPTSPTRR